MIEKEDATELTVNYIKAQTFREVSCDGAIGGMTTRGKLWCAFFTERFALPKVVKYPVNTNSNNDGFNLNENDKRVIEARDGIVRNIEFGVYLSLEEAERLSLWLSEEIQKAKQGLKL